MLTVDAYIVHIKYITWKWMSDMYLYSYYSQECLSLSIQTLDIYLYYLHCSFSLCLLRSSFDSAHSKNPDAYTSMFVCADKETIKGVF